MTLPQIKESTTLLEFYRQLMAGAPIVNGRTVEVAVTVVGGAGWLVPHGLGRVYKGAVVQGVQNIGASVLVTAFPEDVAEPQVNVYLNVSPPADGVVRLWVW